MSNHIPFDIQSEIIQRLPVKSLIQFRAVSKQWKSFIDTPKFIKNYHINHTNHQHHLLVKYSLGTVETYISIIDHNTFPQQKFPLTAPDSLRLLRDKLTLGSVNGLLYFFGFWGDIHSQTHMATIWNPIVRKSIGIVIPIPKVGYIVVGFGVCPDTSDPKIYTYLHVVKVNGSLGLLEYYDEGGMKVCGVWSRKDGDNNQFTKIYTIKVEGKWLHNWVLGFRNNGEVVMELHDADNYNESRIEVYEPLSGNINDVGINGKRGTLYARSYMETLLLLDEADSVIH